MTQHVDILRRYLTVVRGLLLRAARVVFVRLLILLGVGCVIAGLALVYVPAAFVVGGLSVFALLTFDPSRAGRLTWPR